MRRKIQALQVIYHKESNTKPRVTSVAEIQENTAGRLGRQGVPRDLSQINDTYLATCSIGQTLS